MKLGKRGKRQRKRWKELGDDWRERRRLNRKREISFDWADWEMCFVCFANTNLFRDSSLPSLLLANLQPIYSANSCGERSHFTSSNSTSLSLPANNYLTFARQKETGIETASQQSVEGTLEKELNFKWNIMSFDFGKFSLSLNWGYCNLLRN